MVAIVTAIGVKSSPCLYRFAFFIVIRRTEFSKQVVIPTGAYPDFLPRCTGQGRVCALPRSGWICVSIHPVSPSRRRTHLVVECRKRQPILILRIGIVNRRAGLL